MQIDFTPKKLKEAKEYVHLLKNPVEIGEDKHKKAKKGSVFKRILNFLFR